MGTNILPHVLTCLHMARRFRGRRRGGFRRARSFVRKTVSSMGPIIAKRVVLDAIAIPAKTSASFDNPVNIDLLVAQETEDEELESDGSSTAQVKPYSKLVGIKLNLACSTSTAGVYRWMLHKKPDGESLATSTLLTSRFHDSADDPTSRELRGLILAKGFFLATGDVRSRLNIFVRRKTLRRLGLMKEADKITLSIASSLGTADAVHGFGTLYVRPK